jgi:DNA-binding NarL/FixJ family response regulator
VTQMKQEHASDPVTTELVAIRQLLIVALLRSGVSQKQIATALGLHESKLSRALPKGRGRAVTQRRK